VVEDESIGVGRVGNNQTFDVLLGDGESLALLDKDFLVNLKEIFTFHPWLSGKSSEENDDIGIFEHLIWLVSMPDLSVYCFTDSTRG
jgi:hypothetical protein